MMDMSKEKQCKERRLYISPLAPVPLICFGAVAGTAQLLPAMLAVVLHELGHIGAIFLCKGRIRKMIIYPFGGEIVTEREMLSYKDSILVSLAGIIINLLSACILVLEKEPGFFSRFGVYSLGLALFNLLPLRQLDGGSALLTAVTALTDPERGERICGIVFRISGILFLLFAFYGMYLMGFNPTILLLCCYLLFELF